MEKRRRMLGAIGGGYLDDLLIIMPASSTDPKSIPDDIISGRYYSNGGTTLTVGSLTAPLSGGGGYNCYLYYNINSTNYKYKVFQESGDSKCEYIVFGKFLCKKTTTDYFASDGKSNSYDGDYEKDAPFVSLGFNYNYNGGWRSVGNHKFKYIGDGQGDGGGYGPVGLFLCYCEGPNYQIKGYPYKLIDELTQSEIQYLFKRIGKN